MSDSHMTREWLEQRIIELQQEIAEREANSRSHGESWKRLSAAYDTLHRNFDLMVHESAEDKRRFLEQEQRLAEAIALLERCSSGYVMQMQEARPEAQAWLAKHKQEVQE